MVLRSWARIATGKSSEFTGDVPALSQAEVPVRVRFAKGDEAEYWSRTFGHSGFLSRQYEGAGKSERLLVERFGALEFAMALVLERDRLRLITRRWRVFGLAMPLWLAPRSTAHETAATGVFQFFVEPSTLWLDCALQGPAKAQDKRDWLRVSPRRQHC